MEQKTKSDLSETVTPRLIQAPAGRVKSSESGKEKKGENTMKIEKGMIFKGNVNNVCFEVLSANEKVVTYRVLLNGSKISEKIHTFGRQAFEHCNLARLA